MKHRIIALCIVFAMLLSFASSMATVGTAASIRGRQLTGVKVYDAENNLTRESEYQYEGRFLTGILDRRIYEEDTYEYSTTLTYDAGRLTSRISGDPDIPGMNSGTEYTYNGAGQMVSRRSWEGGSATETYEYDAEGKRIRAVLSSDPGEAITEYSYNEKGLLIGATETWTNEWDGEVTTSTTAYSYDSQNRLIRESYSGRYGDAETTYSYQYQPFVLRESSRDYSSTELLLLDNSGLNLESFYLNEPEFFLDSKGYLAKVVDTDSLLDEVKTYEFYYDGVAAETDSENPALFEGNLNEFMEQEAYQAYWASTVSDYRVPAQYAFIDINKDGNQELIICSDNEMGFYSFALFEYHKDTDQVTPLPIPEPGYEIHSCYGGLEYSDMYSAIVFTETNDGTVFGGLAYYSMNGGILDRCFSIGFENYDGSGRKYHTSEKDDISEEKYYEYISESVVVEFLPIADFVPAESSTSAYEEYARSEWIEQHMEYAASDEYQAEIVGGYNGRMLAVFRDALDDGGIGGYRLAKNTSKILGLDFELSETEMYELILAEILYSRASLNMGAEAYKENYNKACQDSAKLLVTTANVLDGSSKIPKDAVNSINELYAVLKTLRADSADFDATYAQIVKEIKENVSEPDLIKGFKSDAAFMAIGIAVDALFETYDSLEDVLQYMNNYIAYQSTSRQLKEVLARLAVVVLYEYEGLYGVEELEELEIWDAMVNWGDFSVAITSFMTALADYEQDGAAAVAEYAVERAKEGGQKIGNKALKSIVLFGLDTIASKIPILNTIVLAKDVLNVGVLLTEVLTNVDEREYTLDMLTKIYCISVALDKAVDDCADAMDEGDFYASTVFDESVNVYSGTQLLASDFALKYADMVLANAEADLCNYDEGNGFKHLFSNREKLVAIVEWYSNSYKLLEEQRTEIQSIACHDAGLSYNQQTDEITYDFRDSRIYVVACPVDVIVKNESGEQIAYLSGEENEILDGYEFYFRTIKIQDDSGEYIKVAIVPNHYQIEMKGTDNGVMNAFVADFTTADVGEVETYFNIPVEKDSVGYFEVSAEATDQSSLVMDQVAYTNMESEADLPTNWGNFNTWIWVAGGAVVFAVILIVIFSIKKKSRK